MMIIRRWLMLAALLVGLAACTQAPASPSPTPADTPAAAAPTLPADTPTAATAPRATATPAPSRPPASPTLGVTATPDAATMPPTFTPPPTVEAAAEPEPTATLPPLPAEAILIQAPGPGSRVLSPVRVTGVADPTFEQTLVVRLVSADGTELALVPTTIQADLGQRGPFEVEVPFEVSGEQPGFIQVLVQSARDGGLTHVASVGVLLAADGAANVQPAPDHPEAIAILAPQTGDTISGGTVRVEGVGRAGFENTLVVDLLDADGNVAGRQAVTVQSELGQWGPFSVDLPYQTTAAGPGRVVVRDVSPAFGGTAHLSSVEVTLAP